MSYEHKGTFTRSFYTKAPGHFIEFTDMAKGGIRAECSCGIWSDFTDFDNATKYAKRHIHIVKRAIKQLDPATKLRIETSKKFRPLSLSEEE